MRGKALRGISQGIVRLSLVIGSLLVAGDLLAADERLLVRELGNPSQFEVTGSKTFTEEQIRDGLARNFEFQKAAHPTATFSDYLSRIKALVERGYQRSGFAAVKVDVTLKDDSVVAIHVDEGTRSLCRNVRITAPAEIDAAALEAFLLQPHQAVAPAGPPQVPAAASASLARWPAGDPADFSGGLVKQMEATLQEGLKRQGRENTTLKVTVEPEANGNATLKVVIESSGPQAVVGPIEIEGLQRFTREQVLEAAGLREGEPLTTSLVQEVERRLMATARFLHRKVAIVPGKDGQPSILRISVRELPTGTPLGEPLTEREQTMARMAEWMARWAETDDDLVVRVAAVDPGTNKTIDPKSANVKAPAAKGTVKPALDFEIVMSAKQGVLIRGNLTTQEWGKWSLAILFQADRIVVFNPRRKEHWEMRSQNGPLFSQSSLNVTLSLDGHPDRTSPHLTTLNFGAGFTPNHTGKASPLGAVVKFNPALAVMWANEPKALFDERDGELTLTTASGRVRMDATTGRLIESTRQDEMGDSRVRFEQGGYAARVKDLDDQLATSQAAFDARSPVGSFFEFAANQLLQSESPAARQASVLLKLIRRTTFERLEGLAKSLDTKNQFVIPATTPEGWMQQLAGEALQWNAKIFPDEHWSEIIGRESILLVSGNPETFLQGLGKVYNSYYTGPLGYLYSSAILSRIHPVVGQNFARQGLKKLATREFLKDCDALLKGDGILGDSLRELASALKTLSPEELKALASLTPDEAKRPAVEAALLEFSRTDSDPVATLRKVLEALWTAGLQAEVRDLLQQAAGAQEVRRS